MLTDIMECPISKFDMLGREVVKPEPISATCSFDLHC